MDDSLQSSVEEERQHLICLEQLKLLYEGIPFAFAAHFIAGLIIIAVQWPVIEHAVLLSWFSVLNLVSLARIILVHVYQRRRDTQRCRFWQNAFVVGTGLAGLTWASAGIWLFPPDNLAHQVIVGFALVGMAAGAVTTLSYHYIAVLSFVLPIMLSLAISFFTSGSTIGMAIGAAALLLLSFLMTSGYRIYHSTRQNILFKLDSRAQQLALRNSEQRLRTLLDTAADAFFLHDQFGHFIDVNQAACDSLGYTRAELLGLNVPDVEMKTRGPEIQVHWDELEAGDKRTINGEHRRKDGTTFPIEVRMGVIREENQKLFSILARDVTARQLYETALKQSEQRFHNIFNASPMGIFLYELLDDERLIFKEANPAADEILGVDCRDFIGLTLEEAFPPLAETDIPYHYREVGRHGTIWHSEEVNYQGEKIQGAFDVFAFSTQPGIIAVMFLDITKRKQTEYELQVKRASLADAQHIAKLGNWAWDLVTGHIEWSDEVFNIFGYDKNMVKASQENFIKAMHPDDIPLMQASEQRAMQGQRYFDEEWRIITTSQQLKYIHLRGERFFNDEGLPVRMVGTLQDVTERKQVEIIKNEFISTVSHEIRTPLTSIMGSLSIMKSGILGEGTKETSNMVRIAYDNSQRLLLLINDILDISKIEAGGLQLNREPVSLPALVRESIELNAGYIKQYNAKVKFDIDEDDAVMVNGDKGRLLQVMSNLLSNAAKFTEAGDSIEVKVARRNNVVRVFVRDHGPGIKDEFIPRVFERFTQSDASDTRKTGGTGLGLNISKQIIEAHRGTIEFMTSENGTSFYFELPVYLA